MQIDKTDQTPLTHFWFRLFSLTRARFSMEISVSFLAHTQSQTFTSSPCSRSSSIRQLHAIL